ncbi:PAS domain-containing protein [Sandaracinus amylolyticus]|uniref:histidine kinase n=1 Tax=Sandaracinus amylolyticus TaxID=927083 RepID=A0A0F6W4R5_9BACT|nr:PAS domain-containing protein [Sandaracinus amylolyticus]AKF07443.1 Phytochrome, two-component sensor histidine kinase [Sandaracinus amylolyticus]
MRPELDFVHGEAFRLSPNAYMVLDRDLRYVAANDAYLRETASRLEDLVGKYVFDLFPNVPDDPNDASRQRLRRSLEKAVRTGETDVLAFLPYRVPTLTPSGPVVEQRFWSATHTPLKDARGQVAYVLQHTVDVTELHRLREVAARAEGAAGSSAARDDSGVAEAGVLARARRVEHENQLLDDERRRLLHLFDQAPSFMAFLRGERHVFDMANDAYRSLVGGRDVVGRTVAEALPEVVEQGFIGLLDGVYRDGRPWIGRSVRVELDFGGAREDRYIDFIYQPIRNRAGEVEGIFVQGHDITEQKKAESIIREMNERLEQRVAARTEALAEANRELESFSYSVSHDLRAPLRHISGFADMLKRRGASALDATSREYLETIADAAQQGGRLVDELLAFSRMGRAQLSVRELDLAELVAAVRSDLAPEIGERNIEWRIGALPAVTADPTLLRSVVKNLLSNAVKYTRTREVAHIEIGAAREQGEAGTGVVHVWVADDGVGFDMRYVDKLFGVFQRLHAPEEFEGTGIGLANVRRIVTRHGGRVWAEGRPGEGATFHFTLPA